MSRHTTFFELLDALDQPGCALCRLSGGSVREYFAAFGYELVNDVPLRERIRDNGGFCARHAWQFVEEGGNRLGAAIVYRDLLHHSMKGLKERSSSAVGGLGRRLGRLFGSEKRVESFQFSVFSSRERPSAGNHSCLACVAEAESERRYGSTLLEHLAEPDVRERYTASGGLCLPHLERTFQAGERAKDLSWLAADAVRRLGGLVAELDEFVRKHDYRFQRESWGEERDSPFRAVERAVGRRW